LSPLAVVERGWVHEDALISFRDASNILEGHGPVFNVGERVQGFTRWLRLDWDAASPCALSREERGVWCDSLGRVANDTRVKGSIERRPMQPRPTPLPSAALHILLALGPEERHGYAIMREVEPMTGGAVRMGPGTLYTAIQKMLASGLIEESAERPDPALDDERRRYYRVTAAGREVVRAETRRLAALVERARSQGLTTWARERLR